METLPAAHSDIHRELLNGEFCVQRSSHGFAQIAVDQAIESTINCDTKTRGELIGITKQPAAIHKWIINAHYRAEATSKCREMAGLTENNSTQHKGASPFMVKADECAVEDVLRTVKSWTNSFAGEQDLINLSSGVAATSEVQANMREAHELGDKQFQEFVEKRLHQGSVSFNSKLPQNKLNTFAAMTKVHSPASFRQRCGSKS